MISKILHYHLKNQLDIYDFQVHHIYIKSMDNDLSPDERNFHAMRANSFDKYYREKGKNDRLMKTPKRDGESDESFYQRARLKNSRINAQDSAFDSGKMKYKNGKWREEK